MKANKLGTVSTKRHPLSKNFQTPPQGVEEELDMDVPAVESVPTKMQRVGKGKGRGKGAVPSLQGSRVVVRDEASDISASSEGIQTPEGMTNLQMKTEQDDEEGAKKEEDDKKCEEQRKKRTSQGMPAVASTSKDSGFQEAFLQSLLDKGGYGMQIEERVKLRRMKQKQNKGGQGSEVKVAGGNSTSQQQLSGATTETASVMDTNVVFKLQSDVTDVHKSGGDPAPNPEQLLDSEESNSLEARSEEKREGSDSVTDEVGSSIPSVQQEEPSPAQVVSSQAMALEPQLESALPVTSSSPHEEPPTLHLPPPINRSTMLDSLVPSMPDFASLGSQDPVSMPGFPVSTHVPQLSPYGISPPAGHLAGMPARPSAGSLPRDVSGLELLLSAAVPSHPGTHNIAALKETKQSLMSSSRIQPSQQLNAMSRNWKPLPPVTCSPAKPFTASAPSLDLSFSPKIPDTPPRSRLAPEAQFADSAVMTRLPASTLSGMPELKPSQVDLITEAVLKGGRQTANPTGALQGQGGDSLTQGGGGGEGEQQGQGSGSRTGDSTQRSTGNSAAAHGQSEHCSESNGSGSSVGLAVAASQSNDAATGQPPQLNWEHAVTTTSSTSSQESETPSPSITVTSQMAVGSSQATVSTASAGPIAATIPMNTDTGVCSTGVPTGPQRTLLGAGKAAQPSLLLAAQPKVKSTNASGPAGIALSTLPVGKTVGTGKPKPRPTTVSPGTTIALAATGPRPGVVAAPQFGLIGNQLVQITPDGKILQPTLMQTADGQLMVVSGVKSTPSTVSMATTPKHNKGTKSSTSLTEISNTPPPPVLSPATTSHPPILERQGPKPEPSESVRHQRLPVLSPQQMTQVPTLSPKAEPDAGVPASQPAKNGDGVVASTTAPAAAALSCVQAQPLQLSLPSLHTTTLGAAAPQLQLQLPASLVTAPAPLQPVFTILTSPGPPTSSQGSSNNKPGSSTTSTATSSSIYTAVSSHISPPLAIPPAVATIPPSTSLLEEPPVLGLHPVKLEPGDMGVGEEDEDHKPFLTTLTNLDSALTSMPLAENSTSDTANTLAICEPKLSMGGPPDSDNDLLASVSDSSVKSEETLKAEEADIPPSQVYLQSDADLIQAEALTYSIETDTISLEHSYQQTFSEPEPPREPTKKKKNSESEPGKKKVGGR